MLENKDQSRTSLSQLGEFGLIEHLTKNFSITHDLELGHLTKINLSCLNAWQKNKTQRGNALDILYNLYPQTNK